MRKKLNTFFLSLLVGIYIATSIGIPVYLHYCEGELEDVSAFVKKVSCCEGEDEQEADGCCKNVTKHLSFNAEFLFLKEVKVNVVKAFYFSHVLNFFGMRTIFSVYQPLAYGKYIPDEPPSKRSSNIISNGVFRI